MGVVSCTCNPATLEAKFLKGVGSTPAGVKNPSMVWVECVATCNPVKWDKSNYILGPNWDVTMNGASKSG